TMASAPTRAPNTPPAAFRAPGSSATTAAGICWWATTRRCVRPSSPGCARRTRDEVQPVVTWIAWVGAATGVLLASLALLAAVGAWRWSVGTRVLMGRLEAQRRPASPLRFDAARELDGLPPPVQRFLRAALADGTPLLAALS